MISNDLGEDTLYRYPGASLRLRFTAGPDSATLTISPPSTVTRVDGIPNMYIMELTDLQQGITPVCVGSRLGDRQAMECINLVVERPAVRGRTRELRSAIIGRKYNPSTQWESGHIPDAHYQTVVELNGTTWSRPGTQFQDADLPEEMIVRENADAPIIRVYWRPDGTFDRSRWALLLSTVEAERGNGVIWPGEVRVSYQAPEQTEGFEFALPLDLGSDKTEQVLELDGIKLSQNLGPFTTRGIDEAGIYCEECAKLGISAELVKRDEFYWKLRLHIDTEKAREIYSCGRTLPMMIDMTGRGNTHSGGTITVKILPYGN
jgi:hypothetical protein